MTHFEWILVIEVGVLAVIAFVKGVRP